ncbi:MAG: PIG-L family deacetylase [Acidimicrobiia bacterium]|nr:PIG-L family deacetylase [Acidimicrobiia bacterium]
MARLLDLRPSSALAVYAHPDDLEISCGGTLSLWSASGCSVHVVVCTRGEKGSADPEEDTAALARSRAMEARAAAEVLGVKGFEQLGYDDGTVENDVHLRGRLVGLVRRLRPECVVTSDPTATFFGSSYVNHHDHREVGWATLDACAPAAASPLYFPEAGPAHGVATLLLSGTLEADAWVDISDTVERKAEALRCHRTQLGTEERWVDELVRRRAAEEGDKVGVRYAEGYRCIRLH